MRSHLPANQRDFHWGRVFTKEQEVNPLPPLGEEPGWPAVAGSVLAWGQGRSYGDACLLASGTLLPTNAWNRVESFDADTGVVICQAGVTLGQLLEVAISHGWIVPVLPGTQFVTVGGAIAADVHGKNHHHAGTFGRHVLWFDLLRSDRDVLRCSASENADLYAATIGGLGFTGIIARAAIQLTPFAGNTLETETFRTKNLDDFYRLTTESDRDFPYTVMWLDTSSGAKARGVFMRARSGERYVAAKSRRHVTVPSFVPGGLLNRASIQIFNQAYYWARSGSSHKKSQDLWSYFFPLDQLLCWNRLYGKRGFFQYQCVLPFDQPQALVTLLDRIEKAGMQSFLSVLKAFAAGVESPGILSFPRPGVTVALDFSNTGPSLFQVFDALDRIVLEAGGRVYLVKDARLSPEACRAMYPNLDDFLQFRDPKIQSDLGSRLFLSSHSDGSRDW